MSGQFPEPLPKDKPCGTAILAIINAAALWAAVLWLARRNQPGRPRHDR